MGDKGLDGIAESLFNMEYKEARVPAYADFIKAFEKHIGLKQTDYKVQPLDELIHSHTEDRVYVMDTYEGLHARLKDYVKRRSYDEIFTQNESWIWGEIYIDAGIEKHKFMPVMLSEWEIFWNEKYQQIKEQIGKTDHLDKLKAGSWPAMQVFMECYEGAGNIIELAEEIDDMELYPLAVISMLEIFDADTCYNEYCEYEFERPDSERWESIVLYDENKDGPFFYIKPYDL